MCLAVFFIVTSSIKLYPQEFNLIDNSFNSFSSEDDNNLWISSQGGWNRYDGNDTYYYRTNDTLSELKGEWIQSNLYCDNENILWSSTYEYICTFDYELDRFDCFHPVFKQDTLKQDIKVFGIDIDESKLLVRAGDNLYYFDISSKRLTPLINDEVTNGQNFTVQKDSNYYRILASPWISNNEFEIWSKTSTKWEKRLIDFSECPKLKTCKVSNSLVYKDQIWLCTNLGLIILNENAPCASQLYKYNDSEYISSYALLFEDRILVTTEFNGLLVFDLHNYRFSRKFSNEDKDYPLLSNRPIEIFDFDQNIGIGHRYKGIQFLPKAYIRSKLQFANDGKMLSPKLIAAEKSLIATTDRTSKISIYKNDVLYDQIQESFDGFVKTLIIENNSVYFSDDNTIWEYKVDEKSIAKLFSDKNISINEFTSFENKLKVVANNTTYDLIENELVLQSKKNKDDESISIVQLTPDLELIAKADHIEIHKNGFINSIETNSYFYSVLLDSVKNRLLVGLGKGLGIINLKTLDLSIIDIDNARVDDLIEVTSNEYILNSSKGLFYLKNDSIYKRINYGKEVLDFAVSNEYLHYIDNDGMYTIPLNDLNEKKQTSIFIESASYENEEENPSLTYSYTYTDNPLSLRISSNDWLSNQNGYFTYQVKSIHESAIRQSYDQPINLPGRVEGSYILEIQGYGSDLSRSKKINVNIDISGPFWRQWWFYLASMLSMFLIAFLYFRSKNKRIQENYRIQKNISDLERSALQAQMNPHFIFNCLNSIQGFIMDNEKEQAMEYLGGFAQLIRSNLNASTSVTISLFEEHRILHNYLKLERLRLNNSFEFEISLPYQKDASDIMIPPMLIQPFVENAVIHGMRNGIKKGLIKIVFSLSEARLNVTISDNGDTKLPPVNIDGHKSVGVDITRKRLNYINQSDTSIEDLIIDHTSSGTIVTLSILLD